MRHVVEHMADVCPVVQPLDAPVPQMVDTVLEFFRALDLPVVEQVIAVPKISTDRVSQRLVERRLPQMVEQLVEVSTTVSYSSLQRTVEQHVDIPVLGGGGSVSGLHGFLPRQRSTASLSRKRISERIVEQIVDPVSRGGLHGSSSSHSPAGDEEGADEPCKGGFFALFPTLKKVRSWARTRSRNCSPSRAHPRRLLSGRRRWRSCSLSRSSSGRRRSGPGFVSSSAPLPRQGGGRGRRGGRSGCRSPPRDILFLPEFELRNLDIILRALRSGSLLFCVLVLLGSTVDTVLVSVLRGFGFLPHFLRVGLGS